MGRLKDFWNRITGIEAVNYQRQVAQMQIRLNTAHNQVNEAKMDVNQAKISAESLKTQLKEANDHAFVSQKEAGENLDIFTHRFTEAMSKAMGAYIELVAPKVGWSKIYEAQVILADTLSYDPILIEFVEAKKILKINMASYYASEDMAFHLLDCEDYHRLLSYLEAAAFGTDKEYEWFAGQIEVLSYWKIDKSTPEYQEYREKVEEATAKNLLVKNLYRAGVEDLELVEQAIYHYDEPVQQVEHQEKETQEEEDDMEMSM